MERIAGRAFPRTIVACAVVLSLLLGVHRSAGQDLQPPPPDRGAVLDRLERALDEDAGLSEDTREALLDLVRMLRRGPDPDEPAITLPAQADGSSAMVPASPTAGEVADRHWWEDLDERLAVYGDARFRWESSFIDNGENRDRGRLRFRLGGDYRFNDEVVLGARLTTGDPDDPRSPYHDFGDAFRKFDISIDRAFVRYEPAWGEGLSVTAGKFGNPIVRNPVYGELVYDADVQPEGVVASWRREDGPGRSRPSGWWRAGTPCWSSRRRTTRSRWRSRDGAACALRIRPR